MDFHAQQKFNKTLWFFLLFLFTCSYIFVDGLLIKWSWLIVLHTIFVWLKLAFKLHMLNSNVIWRHMLNPLLSAFLIRYDYYSESDSFMYVTFTYTLDNYLWWSFEEFACSFINVCYYATFHLYFSAFHICKRKP